MSIDANAWIHLNYICFRIDRPNFIRRPNCGDLSLLERQNAKPIWFTVLLDDKSNTNVKIMFRSASFKVTKLGHWIANEAYKSVEDVY